VADPSKTEQATPKRKQEARERGQIARSVELNSAIILLTALITIRYVGPYLLNSMGKLTVFTYENLSADFGMENVYSYTIFYMTYCELYASWGFIHNSAFDSQIE